MAAFLCPATEFDQGPRGREDDEGERLVLARSRTIHAGPKCDGVRRVS